MAWIDGDYLAARVGFTAAIALSPQVIEAYAGAAELAHFAELLHEGWELKRSVVSAISTDTVDEWYRRARAAGAEGGKLLGAGGGGFLLLMAEPEHHEAIREKLGRPQELPVRFDPRGARVIFIGDRS